MKKAAYDPTILRRIIEEQMYSIVVAGATHIFTDGSVDTEYESAGAALCTASVQAYWRLGGLVSSIQTELFAIQQAFAYVIAQNTQNAIIHTDSKAALQILGQKQWEDNVEIITTILYLGAVAKGKGLNITLNWIPSNVGIPLNAKADEIAKLATRHPVIHKTIQPSLENIKNIITKKLSHLNKAYLHQRIAEGSPSATWYLQATKLERLNIPKGIHREIAVRLYRLRLGYRCNWEIGEPRQRKCIFCQTVTEKPLLHYLLECEATNDLRRALRVPESCSGHPEAFNTATLLVNKGVQQLDTLIKTVRVFW